MIQPVEDRLGHDRRYSVNWSKIHTELGYTPQYSLANSVEEIIQWYRTHPEWWQPLKSKAK
jgi:dTDP-glucose 4,6-dehydratase